MGLPRFWGRVGAVESLVGPDNGEQSRKRAEGKATGVAVKASGGKLSIGWTVAYYVILVAGVVGFWMELWTLTESASTLIQFHEGRHAGLGME